MRLIRNGGQTVKRVGFIFDKITDPQNILEAIRQSSKGKRDQTRVARVISNAEQHANEISRMLIAGKYKPSPYITRTIHDGTSGKNRLISKPRYYPDQIIHWALMLQLQPIIMRGMYAHNCGSIPGRGTGHGQKMIRKWLNNDARGTKYCLKLDITQFYPSVNASALKGMFRRKLKDPHALQLIDSIIDSAGGLPIGNFTSQWFANFYLEGLDHFIKQKLRARYYLRYVDDLHLFGPNKRELHKARAAISDYLEGIHLRLKSNWQVFRVDSRAVDALGFRFYRDRTTLRRRTALRMRRRVRKISRKPTLNERDAAAIISYWGWLKRSDSRTFYRVHFRPFVSVRTARRELSKYAQLRNHRARQALGCAPGRVPARQAP